MALELVNFSKTTNEIFLKRLSYLRILIGRQLISRLEYSKDFFMSCWFHKERRNLFKKYQGKKISLKKVRRITAKILKYWFSQKQAWNDPENNFSHKNFFDKKYFQEIFLRLILSSYLPFTLEPLFIFKNEKLWKIHLISVNLQPLIKSILNFVFWDFIKYLSIGAWKS